MIYSVQPALHSIIEKQLQGGQMTHKVCPDTHYILWNLKIWKFGSLVVGVETAKLKSVNIIFAQNV